MFNPQAFEEFFNSFVHKICFVGRDQSVGDSKLAYNVLSNELSNIGCQDGGNGLSLYPYGEVINAH